MATANEIWRDFATEGVPASGPHKPVKADIRAWGSAIEAVGGVAIPGIAKVPLFSNGIGVPPVYRAITGEDLNNPSLDLPGAVYAKPGVANQVVSGLGTDGDLDFAPVTGTGNVVLSDAPSFTGIIKHGLLNFLSSLSSTHIFYAPDGRLGVQLAATHNFYKAPIHHFSNFDGTDVFALLDANTFDLQPATLTGSSALSAAKVTQTWNTSGTPRLIDLQVIDTASNAASQIMRVRAGAAGTTQIYGLDKNGGGIFAGNVAIAGVLVIGGQNYLVYNGSQMDHFSPLGGIRWLNNAGIKARLALADGGTLSFFGDSSGQHDLITPAAAGGASTWPTTTGTLVNTGNFATAGNFPQLRYHLSGVNANSVGDNPITINLPNGATKFRVAVIGIKNVGATASLTTAQYGVFSAAAGGGTAYVPSGTALNALTATGTDALNAFTSAPSTNFASSIFNSGKQFFFRITQAQGASATIDVSFSVEIYP